MPQLNEMIIDLTEATKIAEWLVDDEVKLEELNKYNSFASKADKVDIAVWKKCKNEGTLKRYLDIYANKGDHSKEVLITIQKEDDDAWDKACTSGSFDAFDSYLKKFGTIGRHYEAAQTKKDEITKKDDDAWAEACALDTYADYDNYRKQFKNHDGEAKARMDEILKEQEERKGIDEAAWMEACRLDTYTDYGNYRKKFNYKGIHDSDAKIKMDEILRVEEELRKAEEARRAEEALWNEAVNKNTIASYQSYLDTYGSSGPHGTEAKNNKERLEEEQRVKLEREKVEQKRKMIEDLSKNANAFSIDEVKAKGITPEELRGKLKDSHGIVRDDLLKSWYKPMLTLTLGETPDNIDDECTEVYFWGDPGSGKTCAMAAILSCVDQLGYFIPRQGPGAEYMSQLTDVFSPTPNMPASILPPGTSVEQTQYMPMTLNKDGEHNLAIIELSGEVFKCFRMAQTKGEKYFADTDKDPEKDRLAKTYKQVKKFLASKNPKYHFFVLDSQSDDATQAANLNYAAAYFNQNKLFNSTTLGISLIVTKCDRLSPDVKKWRDCAIQCAQKRAPSLVQSLKAVVKSLELTDGRIEVIPLSIGEVVLKRLCEFNSNPATAVVDILLQYAKVGEKIVKTKSWKNIVNN